MTKRIHKAEKSIIESEVWSPVKRCYARNVFDHFSIFTSSRIELWVADKKVKMMSFSVKGAQNVARHGVSTMYCL